MNMSLIQDSTLLGEGTYIVVANVSKEGNVTCTATNQAGSDLTTFPVTITGLPFLLFSFVLIFSFGNLLLDFLMTNTYLIHITFLDYIFTFIL